jgi:hypothetical protein
MKYKEYEKAFSAARLNKYLHACGGNTDKALQLYRLNIKLCQKLYGVLNVFEIVLRNAIHEHYKNFFSDSDWIKTQLSDGGMLSRVDTTFARTHFMLILKYLSFLGYKEGQILFGLDVQPNDIFQKIDEIARMNIHDV